jgi:hypothetical protein
VIQAPSKEELEAAHCWEASDRVPGRPEMTAFRRACRLRQARWREAEGYPIGSQPIVPRSGKPVRPVGNRLQYDFAHESGANFVTAGAHAAAKARLSTKEPEQSVDAQRIWAEMLWSPTMCFNLFGDVAADLARADRAVHALWPDAPGTVSGVRFAHSPGWLDRSYLGNLSSFDAAFELDAGDGTKAIIGVATKYYDYVKHEVPKPANLPRYLDVAKKSGVFARGAIGRVHETDLLVTWLDHLLLLSMLQHAEPAWSWGRYVVVHAGGNVDYADACERYRTQLADTSTFASLTVEALLDTRALPRATVAAVRDRYV